MTQPAQQPGNPNFPPNPSGPEQNTPDPFEFFTVENIENMREAQKQARAEEMQNADPFNPQERRDAEARAAARYDEIRDDYIHSFDYLRELANLDPTDPDYPIYEGIMNHLGHVSIDQMNDDEWQMGQFDTDGNKVAPSGQEMVEEIHDDRLAEFRQHEADAAAARAAANNPQPAPVNPNSDPTQQLFTPDQLRDYTEKVDARHEAFAKLTDARDRLAELTVKRQGKLKDEASPEYRAAHAAYMDAQIAYGKAGEAMKDAAYPGRTDDERKADVTEYLLHEQAKLREITNEKWDNTTVNKICKWMAKGNVAQRVLKGIALGGAITAGTALITTVTAGTAGGAALAGAAAGTGMLLRGMRTYGAVRGHELNRGNQDTSMTGTGPNELNSVNAMFRRDVYAEVSTATSAQNALEKGAHLLLGGHEEAIQAEQKKNRRATYISVGSLVLGSLVTTGVAVGADHLTGFSDKMHGLWDNVMGNKPEGVGSRVVPPEGPGSGKPPVELNPPEPSNNAVDHLSQEQYKAMATVDKGMGGIELFKEIGLSESDWYQHEQALLKAHPGDFYQMDDGHVGIKHPGKLSEGAMRDIAHRTGIWQTK